MSAISGIMPISPISSTPLTEQVGGVGQNSSVLTGSGVKTSGGDFAQYLTSALEQVNASQKEGEAASVGLATGQVDDMHTAMVALEKADLSMSLAVEVRNKVLDAYHEMMRMQI